VRAEFNYSINQKSERCSATVRARSYPESKPNSTTVLPRSESRIQLQYYPKERVEFNYSFIQERAEFNYSINLKSDWSPSTVLVRSYAGVRVKFNYSITRKRQSNWEESWAQLQNYPEARAEFSYSITQKTELSSVTVLSRNDSRYQLYCYSKERAKMNYIITQQWETCPLQIFVYGLFKELSVGKMESEHR
jgi:hypothetical protein